MSDQIDVLKPSTQIPPFDYDLDAPDFEERYDEYVADCLEDIAPGGGPPVVVEPGFPGTL